MVPYLKLGLHGCQAICAYYARNGVHYSSLVAILCDYG